jgi:hypothetical protein
MSIDPEEFSARVTPAATPRLLQSRARARRTVLEAVDQSLALIQFLPFPESALDAAALEQLPKKTP